MAAIGFRCFQIAASTRNLLTATLCNFCEHSASVITDSMIHLMVSTDPSFLGMTSKSVYCFQAFEQLCVPKSRMPLACHGEERTIYARCWDEYLKSIKHIMTLMIRITERTRCATQEKLHSSSERLVNKNQSKKNKFTLSFFQPSQCFILTKFQSLITSDLWLPTSDLWHHFYFFTNKAWYFIKFSGI